MKFIAGYNNVPWSWSFDAKDVFYADLPPVSRPLKSFAEEAVQAAREIGDAHQGEQIHVLYSGGVDSEAVVESFRRANVPMKVISVRAADGTNAFEIEHVAAYQQRSGLKIDVVDFDHRDWIASVACQELCMAAQCPHAGVIFHVTPVAERYRGKIFFDGNFVPEIVKRDSIWHLYEEEFTGYAVWKAFRHFDSQAIGFYGWSSELYLSWFCDPFWNKVFKASTFFNSNQLKSHFLNEQLGLTPRAKIEWYRGFPVLSHSIWTRKFQVPLSQWLGERLAAIELGGKR